MLYSIVVFRRKEGDDEEGQHFEGNTTLEIVWTVVPLILVIVFAFSLIRMIFYQGIPDVEQPVEDHKSKNFFGEMREMLKDTPFRKYTIFRFAMPLLTGSVALMFNLYEKKYMGFEPKDFILMGNLMFKNHESLYLQLLV